MFTIVLTTSEFTTNIPITVLTSQQTSLLFMNINYQCRLNLNIDYIDIATYKRKFTNTLK